jgi:monofunctional biosynthetic peptidoglycan transglycosylase
MAFNTQELLPRIGRFLKRLFILLFLLQLFYLLLLKWIDPPVTLTQISSLLHGYGLKRSYRNISDISPNARLAVMSSEDQLFPDHDGFDFKSIEKAMKHNQKSKSLHGASTISQQVAKNVFLWQGRSWIRKALETYFTFMIELLWSKKRILEVYLNVSEMGKGVFGIEAASRQYFNKSARNLTRQEAALIAACLPSPRTYTIHPMSRHVAARYPWILGQMSHLQEDPDIEKLLE